MNRNLQRFKYFLTGALLAFGSLVSSTANAYELLWSTPDVPEDIAKRLQGASLLETAQRDGVTDIQEIIANAQAEYQRLISVLYSQGYFGPEIHVYVDGREAAALPPFERITAISKIQIAVKPGDSFLFSRAQITPLAPNTQLPDSFATGQPARTASIRKANTVAYEAWRSAGHAKVKIDGTTMVANHQTDTLAVDIDFDPGPMLRFGELTISTESYVRESRLREIMNLPTGEVFDPETLEDGRKRLRRTGAFRSITLAEAKEAGPDDTLDIDLTVADEQPRRIAFEAELESRDGLSLSTYWIHRNIFGGAERLKLEGEIGGIGAQSGGIDYILSAELIRPATFNADSDVAFRLGASRIDDPLYFIEKLEASFTYTRVYSDELKFSTGILVQRSNVRDDFGKRQFMTVGLPLALTYDKRDDKLDSTTGYYLYGIAMPFSGSKSGAPGAYFEADARAFVSPGTGNKFTFAGRAKVGSIVGPSLSQTQPDLLFYTGGGGTVRGQPYQSNTVTVNGITSGGLSYLALSGELRYKIRPTISTVLFYDAGYVGETSNLGGSGNWQSGAGIGFRYHTDFGPIRVDLAAPVSGDTGEGLQLYIGIGQAF